MPEHTVSRPSISPTEQTAYARESKSASVDLRKREKVILYHGYFTTCGSVKQSDPKRILLQLLMNNVKFQFQIEKYHLPKDTSCRTS